MIKFKKRKIRIVRRAKKANKMPESNVSEFEKRKLELKKKRQKIRVKRKLIIFMFFLAAFSVTIFIFKAPFFNIKEIVCVGYERLEEAEILKEAKVVKGRNIFTTNMGDIKERLAAIPYVSESNARRIFPNKIKLWVRECVPAFVVKTGNNLAVCDVNTKVLEITSENTENLCMINLSEAFEVKATDILLDADVPQNSMIIECLKTLENLNMIKKITSIDFTDISDIIILYDNRLKIKLGNTNNISYKLKFISEVINSNISEHEKATIDYTGEKLYVGQFDEKKPETEENAEEKTGVNEKEKGESQEKNEVNTNEVNT